jgi:hypothetical protein
MAKMTPQEHAALWAAKTAAAVDRYKQGIARVTGSPMQKAIAAQDRLLANFTESVVSGKWAAGLAKVSDQQWKTACTEKGAAAMPTAVRLAQEKVARVEAQMANIRDQIVGGLPPRGSIEENLERARQMALRMHEARKRG